MSEKWFIMMPIKFMLAIKFVTIWYLSQINVYTILSNISILKWYMYQQKILKVLRQEITLK